MISSVLTLASPAEIGKEEDGGIELSASCVSTGREDVFSAFLKMGGKYVITKALHILYLRVGHDSYLQLFDRGPRSLVLW